MSADLGAWTWEDNPARPAPGARLIALAELPVRGARAVDFIVADALFSVIVARTEAGIVAYENRCPHARMPLERPDGAVSMQEGRFLICAMHGASFRVADGRCVAGPGLGAALKPFPVTIRDGWLCAA